MDDPYENPASTSAEPHLEYLDQPQPTQSRWRSLIIFLTLIGFAFLFLCVALLFA